MQMTHRPPTVTTSDASDATPIRTPPARSGTQVPERLWRDVHERLTAFVARRVDDPADVADIVQTVLLRLHQHAAAIEDEARLLPWLFRVTRNAIADHYRAPSRRREVRGLDADAAVGDQDAGALSELSGCVRPMVEQLPPTYREALRLVEFEGLAQVEVAERLGLSVSGMKSRVQRGRAMLRDVLLACCEVSLSATGGVIEFERRRDASCGDGSCGPSCAT